MGNTKISFSIESDPHPYVLEYDFNFLCDAEVISGCNLMQAIAGGQITAGQTRGMLYAFLKKANPDLLLSDAGALLSRDLAGTLKAITDVLDTARASDEEESQEEAQVEQPSKAS